MTKQEKSLNPNIIYITPDLARAIYGVFYTRFLEMGEPIEKYENINIEKLNQVLSMSSISFSGKELYPTIFEKTAYIFYEINKGHIFPNGNKRLSIAFMLLFLILNGYEISADSEMLTKKALEIAKSDPGDFDYVKRELVLWIKENTLNK